MQQLSQSFLQALGGSLLLIQQPDDLSEPMQQGAADPCCQQNAEEKGEPTPHKSAAKPSDYPYDQDSPTEEL
ncbi:MAG: hypothetical protein ACLTV2_05020 [Acutalibacter sp.]